MPGGRPVLTPQRIRERLSGTEPASNPGEVKLPGSSEWPASWRRSTGLTPAGVLVPIVERRRGLTVLLTRRTADLKHHGGQVSFPGGRMEPNDNDILETALRETHEEIGVPPEAVRIAGVLGAMPTITGYAVTPVVGLLPETIRLRLDTGEVDRAFEVPLDYVMDPANVRRTERLIEGVSVPLLEFKFGGERIWGATAAMLEELRIKLI